MSNKDTIKFDDGVPFTQVNNKVIRDDDLGAVAIGIYTYLSSHNSEKFKIYKSQVEKRFSELGKTVFNRGWNQLVEKGWIKSERVKGENGKFSHWNHWVISDQARFRIGSNGKTADCSISDNQNDSSEDLPTVRFRTISKTESQKSSTIRKTTIKNNNSKKNNNKNKASKEAHANKPQNKNEKSNVGNGVVKDIDHPPKQKFNYELPSFINKETFDEYLNWRKSKKIPCSKLVINRLIKKMTENEEFCSGNGQMSLENALVNGWKDIFPPNKSNSQNLSKFEQKTKNYNKQFEYDHSLNKDQPAVCNIRDLF